MGMNERKAYHEATLLVNGLGDAPPAFLTEPQPAGTANASPDREVAYATMDE